MNATDGIWIPSYYRHQGRLAWTRAAGGPQVVDWVAGGMLATLVLGLTVVAHGPQRQEAPAAAVAAAPTAAKDSDSNAERVAYVPRHLTVDDK